MKNEIWNEISEIIGKYRTWIDVLDIDKRCDFSFLVNGTIQISNQRVLRLVIKWPTKIYSGGHIFTIPEYELNKAIRSQRHNHKFMTRIQNGKLLPADVELIIRKASNERIKLGLEVY